MLHYVAQLLIEASW